MLADPSEVCLTTTTCQTLATEVRTSQCRTAVSIDTCTAVARFIVRLWSRTRARISLQARQYYLNVLLPKLNLFNLGHTLVSLSAHSTPSRPTSLRALFFVGKRITLTDIFVANVIQKSVGVTIDAPLRAKLPNFIRHFETIVKQPKLKEISCQEETRCSCRPSCSQG
jgi:hypothetical protein